MVDGWRIVMANTQAWPRPVPGRAAHARRTSSRLSAACSRLSSRPTSGPESTIRSLLLGKSHICSAFCISKTSYGITKFTDYIELVIFVSTT